MPEACLCLGVHLVGEFQGENTHTHTLETFHKHEATLSYSGLKLMIQIKKNRFSEINLCLCFVCVGDRYIVADCGGGTVDLTVHQIEQPQGTLKELYKASGNLSVHSTKTQKPPHSQQLPTLSSLSQAGRTGPSAWTWPSRPCCARSLVRTSSRASRPSVRPPGWTSPSRSRRGSGRRRRAGPTPSTSRCPFLS